MKPKIATLRSTPSPRPSGERLPRSNSRIEPLDLPMPHGLPNMNAVRLLSPLRSHSDGRGEGQGEVRARIHGEPRPPRLDAHRSHEPIAAAASWSAATCRRFPRRDVSRRNNSSRRNLMKAEARTCPRTPKNLRVGIRSMESVLKCPDFGRACHSVRAVVS